jgi:hypothetical protein
MVKPVIVARNLLVVAALPLLFCCDLVYWHTLPVGFEGTAAYGGLAFWFGVIVTIVALGLATFSLFRYGKTASRLIVLLCSVAMLVLFGLVFTAGEIRCNANHLTMRWSERLAAVAPCLR